MLRGACLDEDPDLFFPKRGVKSDKAIEICESCPVKPECEEYSDPVEYGVWAGEMK